MSGYPRDCHIARSRRSSRERYGAAACVQNPQAAKPNKTTQEPGRAPVFQLVAMYSRRRGEPNRWDSRQCNARCAVLSMLLIAVIGLSQKCVVVGGTGGQVTRKDLANSMHALLSRRAELLQETADLVLELRSRVRTYPDPRISTSFIEKAADPGALAPSPSAGGNSSNSTEPADTSLDRDPSGFEAPPVCIANGWCRTKNRTSYMLVPCEFHPWMSVCLESCRDDILNCWTSRKASELVRETPRAQRRAMLLPDKMTECELARASGSPAPEGCDMPDERPRPPPVPQQERPVPLREPDKSPPPLERKDVQLAVPGSAQPGGENPLDPLRPDESLESEAASAKR